MENVYTVISIRAMIPISCVINMADEIGKVKRIRVHAVSCTASTIYSCYRMKRKWGEFYCLKKKCLILC